MEMKKILGILLAVCFLMSVTAAAVSAGVPSKDSGWNDKDKYNKNDGKNWGDHNKPKFVWKCHTEYKKKLVKIIYKHHGKPIKIYKWKAVKVCYKVPVHHGYGHR